MLLFLIALLLLCVWGILAIASLGLKILLTIVAVLLLVQVIRSD